MTTPLIIAGAAILFIAGITFYNSKVGADQDYEKIDVKEHWHGPFYYNPKDKRPFLAKRWGGGFTVNFGNPLGVVIFIAFLLLIGWMIYANA